MVLSVAARGILRQWRAAAWVALPWFVVSIGSALAHLGSSARAPGPAVVLVLIARGRPALVGVTDANRRRLAGRAAVAAGTLDSSVGVIGLIVNRSHYLRC
ncbi:MAG: hypothetical protein NVSMB12_16630 [Acidimicrobiales bacterium]